MNLHVPQTEEARSEAIELMSVLNNLITPKNGEPLVAATQDFLTASYLLTRKDVFFDRAEFARIVAFMGDAAETIYLPTPTILKPIECWTGKQCFTSLIEGAVRHTADYVEKKCPAIMKQLGLDDSHDPMEAVRYIMQGITCSLEEKSYSLGGNPTTEREMCPKDGFVHFRGADLVSGQLGKATLGSGSKKGILYVIARRCSVGASANIMNRLAKFTARWHSDAGFSIGIDDVTPSYDLRMKKKALVEAGYAKCEEIIEEMRTGRLQSRPGCTSEQTMEAMISSELSRIREDAGKLCINDLDPRNCAPLVMALCGSKGSNINISQMVSCVGQQSVSGKRPPDGFFGRSLPHFPVGLAARQPRAKGFVENSFFSGLTCTEFFFHTMGGREGLVDTAVKTAETGYMQRRLMKALEDLGVEYDGTVRASDGTIVQFVYGEDGLYPGDMETGNAPLNFHRALSDVKAATFGNEAEYLLPDEIRSHSQKAADAFFDGKPFSMQSVKSKVLDILFGTASKIEKAFARAESYDKSEEELSDLKQTILAARSVKRTHIDAFCEKVIDKYSRAKVEAGTAVGAIGAQSIGEPGTQMTLKTFHFAGVASMNITLGVPRIKEIINASKSIATPIITASLFNEKNLTAARIVKGRIEKTYLGQVTRYIKEVYQRNDAFIVIKLDRALIHKVQLDITADKVCQRILATPKLKLKAVNLQVDSASRISIRPRSDKLQLGSYVQLLKLLLPTVVVEGFQNVGRAVINDMGGGSHNLLVEGDDLLSVMGVPGIQGTKVTSNHIITVEKTLGIEAARYTIMSEIQYTMASHGMSIDSRHVMLLADVMTFRGEVLGITRFGIVKMKTSTLMLASFEMTVDHLFDAAAHGRKDSVVGVSECIIMGIPIPLGTGLFKLLRKSSQEPVPQQRSVLLQDNWKRNVKI